MSDRNGIPKFLSNMLKVGAPPERKRPYLTAIREEFQKRGCETAVSCENPAGQR